MFGYSPFDSIFGMRILAAPEPPPVIRIPDSFEFCSDEFRAIHNRWLLETFGRREPVVRAGTALFSSMYGFAIMNQSDIVKLSLT